MPGAGSDLSADLRALVLLGIAGLLCLTLRQRGQRGTAWAVWTAAIVSVSVPFFDLHAHTHWPAVAWIPFKSPPVKVSDIVANTLLYVPFGFLAFRQRMASSRLVTVVVAAAALSFLAESSQLFSHSRFPSTTDLVCNVVGAAMGLMVAKWFGPVG